MYVYFFFKRSFKKNGSYGYIWCFGVGGFLVGVVGYVFGYFWDGGWYNFRFRGGEIYGTGFVRI